MAEVKIEDKEAEKILAQAVRKLLEDKSEYFMQTRGYEVTSLVTKIVQTAIEKIAQEQVLEILRGKGIQEKVKEHLAKEFTEEKVNDLIRKLSIKVGSY